MSALCRPVGGSVNSWTILIPTIGRRAPKLVLLVNELLEQAQRYEDHVSILAFYNNGERPLGQIRQALVEDAQSHYVSFVDDDDRVPTHYVEKVVEAIGDYAAQFEQWPDQVGWRMQHYSDGVPSKPTYHSLRFRSWWDDDKGYYRDISHLNPVRRELALMYGDFRRGDPPEDVGWSDQMRGHIKTEAYVPDEFVMYHYYSSGDSTWRPGSVSADPAYRRPLIEHPQFRWHPDSSV